MTTYKRASFSHPDFQKLIIDLDKDLWLRYPDVQQNFDTLNFIDESARIILAHESVDAIGCGCFRPMKEKGVIEIKRMYVVSSFRGRGIGKLILRKLEQWAVEDGFTQSKLETGINQPEAIAAYEKSGYDRISNYEPYENSVESICMMKIL